jgi:hypothetical protein
MRRRPQREAADPSDQRRHAAFFEKALAAGSEWTRFADPKLVGVLALLSLGIANLINEARALWDAHGDGSAWGWIACGGFVAAGVLAATTVVCASIGLFPRTRRSDDAPSLLFFGGIASMESPGAYEAAVRAKSAAELEREVAHQAWEVARIAAKKHRWARRAYGTVIAFLIAWVAARVALSFVS